MKMIVQHIKTYGIQPKQCLLGNFIVIRANIRNQKEVKWLLNTSHEPQQTTANETGVAERNKIKEEINEIEK